MDVQLKPLDQQVVVVVGASSGIGLATARLAAKRGARVVLASRSRANLKRAVREIRERGGEAIHVVADVSRPEHVEAIAEAAVREFGGFDSWVNCASSAIVGLLHDTPLSDARRLFDVTYWGVVHGSLVAAEHLRERGGALITVGSVESDRGIPLHGHYAAAKHAVKGFTDVLRMELEKEGAPISVSLVKPSSVDTPLIPRHAKNLTDEQPTYLPPVYSPRVVARTILRCATHPVREITVGAGGRMIAALDGVAPRLTDRLMEGTFFRMQKEKGATPDRGDNLFRPRRRTERERGGYDGHVMNSSAYTHATLHPVQTLFAAALLGAGAWLALRGDPRDEQG